MRKSHGHVVLRSVCKVCVSAREYAHVGVYVRVCHLLIYAYLQIDQEQERTLRSRVIYAGVWRLTRFMTCIVCVDAFYCVSLSMCLLNDLNVYP